VGDRWGWAGCYGGSVGGGERECALDERVAFV